MTRLSYYLYRAEGELCDGCERLLKSFNLSPAETPATADLAVAPLLQRILKKEEWSAPKLGTLIFHPSILPYHRGPDAIRWTVKLEERVSGVTWFWCDGGLDTGPICEQEPVVLLPGESAGRAYHLRFVPAGLRAFERALAGIIAGQPRRVPQEEPLSSYESWVGR